MKTKIFFIGPPIPCINCISLPMCKSYLIENKLPTPNYSSVNFISRYFSPRIIKLLYNKCSLLREYTMESGYENYYLLRKVLTYILEGREHYEGEINNEL